MCAKHILQQKIQEDASKQVERIRREFFKSSYQYENIKILSVTLDDKTLNISTSSGSIWRRNLAKSQSLVVNLISSGYCVSYF